MSYYQLRGCLFWKGVFSVRHMSTLQAETTHVIFSHNMMLYNHWSSPILSMEERVWGRQVKALVLTLSPRLSRKHLVKFQTRREDNDDNCRRKKKKKKVAKLSLCSHGQRKPQANFSQQFKTHSFTVSGDAARVSLAESEIEARCWPLILVLSSVYS